MRKSIIQHDTTKCFLCGLPAGGDPLDKHHVFAGALRKKSEKYGLTVYLHHHKCHIFGPDAAHQSGETADFLHKVGQKVAMKEYGWTVEEFRKEFYKNYL